MIPRPLKLRMAAGIDRAFVARAFRGRRARKRRAPDAQALTATAERYARAEESGELFPDPRAAIAPTVARVRDLDGGQVVDLRWPSPWRPLGPEYASMLERFPAAHLCHARWFRSATPRPALITLNGWGAGWFRMEEGAFAASWLYERGLDPVLFALPFHGRRSAHDRGTPVFPASDPAATNEGFAAAVLEVRGLVRWLLAQGAPSVAIAGMSLGGFTASLLATVEPELHAVTALIPFGSLPDLLEGQRYGSRKSREDADTSLVRRALAPTTPLLRAPVVPTDRMLVAVAARDGVVPPEHGRRLAAHFAGSELIEFPGAHLWQLGRGRAFRAMVALSSDPSRARSERRGEDLRA